MLISDWSSDVCSSDLVDGGSLTVTGTNTRGSATDGALAVEALNGGTLDAVNLVTVSGGTTTLRADKGVSGGDNFKISGGNLQRSEERRVGKEGGRTCRSGGVHD